MLLVRGGSIWIGAVPGDGAALEDESPRHRVDVAPFYVDETEVTCEQFARFIAATGYEAAGRGPLFGPPAPGPPTWRDGATWEGLCEGETSLPVAFVTLDDATAYCDWVDARLPTEEEFEFLLRGGRDGTVYPWGNDPVPPGRYGNYYGEEWISAYPDWSLYALDGYRDLHIRAAPVRSYAPDRNGLYDISGNVAEWCSDPFVFYGEALPEGQEYSRVIRGGSFFSHPGRLRCSWRTSTEHDEAREWWGFRCVRSARPSHP